MPLSIFVVISSSIGQNNVEILLKPVHTVAEKCDCRRIRRTFLRQCGQGFKWHAKRKAVIGYCNVLIYVYVLM